MAFHRGHLLTLVVISGILAPSIALSCHVHKSKVTISKPSLPDFRPLLIAVVATFVVAPTSNALPPLNCNSFGCYPAELSPGTVSVINRPPSIDSASSPRALKVARELKRKHATMYGAYWCSYCNRERQALGKEAFNIIDYVECDSSGFGANPSRCADIKAFPTWEIDGTREEGALGLEGLERLTGLPSPAPTPFSLRQVDSVSSPRALRLAQALKERNVILYGAYWCGFCNSERQAFGKEAAAMIPYVECDSKGKDSNLSKCIEAGVEAFPTWVQANGERHEGALGIEGLERFVGIGAP